MSTFAREIRLAWGMHEVFRRLGFLPEHIFVGVNHGRVVIIVAPDAEDPREVVRLERRLTVTVCPTKLHQGQFEAQWSAAVEQINGHITTERELAAMYAETMTVLDPVGLIVALKAKGMWRDEMREIPSTYN